MCWMRSLVSENLQAKMCMLTNQRIHRDSVLIRAGLEEQALTGFNALHCPFFMVVVL